MRSFMEQLEEAEALSRAAADPWERTLQDGLRNVQAMSTYYLLDLLGVAQSAGNARRLAKRMRAMGWVPLKSRRLMPGTNCGTEIRGWARPFREATAASGANGEGVFR